ncbi:MAG: T9SS type A sorting domain-containing protein [Chitinophagaceae bacterium]|nr:T9SS type A sorting domain-containing protein [Chitinophagaceae bacterium]
MIVPITILRVIRACFANRLLTALMACLLFIFHSGRIQAQSAKGQENIILNTTTDKGESARGINFASIGDFVWIDNNANGKQDAGEPGMPNVEVVLYDSLLNIIDSKYTNDSGYYHFDNIPVPENTGKTFIVGFNNIPPNYAYTNLVSDSLGQLTCSKSDTISGRTKPFLLKAGEDRKDIDGGVKNAPGVVLPLIINQFNGTYADGFIQLGWSTYSEINIDHFDIERSTDGINFRQNGRVSAIGGLLNSNINYSFLDITAQRGVNYYRLAIVDISGNYTYSKTIMVNVDIRGISVMVVYPNPFSRRVKIRVNCDKAEKVAINILNSSGVLISTQQAETTIGDNNIDITKVDALPGGVYFIEVVSSTRSLKTKVMKLN